jgi:hypothetical protein
LAILCINSRYWGDNSCLDNNRYLGNSKDGAKRGSREKSWDEE